MSDDAQKKKNILIQALLSVMGDYAWDQISLIDIARAADMPLADVYGFYDVKEDILASYGRQLDRAVAENITPLREDETCRDRLFDILMERYELLAENKSAVLSLFNAIKYDPSQVCTALPHLNASLRLMLDLAGMDSSGLRGGMCIAGLSVVYLHGIYNFVHDDSADLTKVMAGLDRDLRHAENFTNLISL